MRKLTHQELLNRQENKLNSSGESRAVLSVILNNIRSLHNVGSIFRTCDGVGVQKLWLCGITGYPPHAQIAKTALGAESRVSWEYRRDIVSTIKELKENGYTIVLLEQLKESIPYQNFLPTGPTCLVVGNEVEGVSESIVPFCDQAIEIEMAGLKNSLNVAVAFGVAAYHIKGQLKQTETNARHSNRV